MGSPLGISGGHARGRQSVAGSKIRHHSHHQPAPVSRANWTTERAEAQTIGTRQRDAWRLAERPAREGALGLIGGGKPEPDIRQTSILTSWCGSMPSARELCATPCARARSSRIGWTDNYKPWPMIRSLSGHSSGIHLSPIFLTYE